MLSSTSDEEARVGIHTHFGDVSDPDNDDAQHALRNGWITEGGEITPKGQEALDQREAARRRLQPGWQGSITTGRPTNGRAAGIRAAQTADDLRQVEDVVTRALAQKGYNGGKVKVEVKSGRSPGTYKVNVTISGIGPRGKGAKKTFEGTLEGVLIAIAAHDFHLSSR